VQLIPTPPRLIHAGDTRYLLTYAKGALESDEAEKMHTKDGVHEDTRNMQGLESCVIF
jgi:hypothetical protein